MNRAALVPLLLLLACPGTKEKVATAALAEGCYLNTDCNAPLVCAFKRCHNACNTERDCPAGLSCIASDRPYKVCLLPQESSCVYNTDCPTGLVCAVDLNCHAECVTERDCVSGQVCAGGTCANPAQVNDAGMLSAGSSDAGTERCLYNTDCRDERVCKGGTCVPECRGDRDCRSDEACNAKNTCEQRTAQGVDGGMPSGSGKACLLNSDCPMAEICGVDGRCRYQCLEARDCTVGQCCYQHACRAQSVCAALLPDGGVPPFDGGLPDAGGGTYCLNDLGCDDGNFCDGIELCVNNRCQAAGHPICDDFNPCTTDQCNAATKSCSYIVNGNVDAGDDDHDGHKATACGPGADDCDDTNPNVYWGHPEECDFVDNNCNGMVDEGLWRERSGARIALHGTAKYPWWAGKPAVVRVDGGYVVAVSSDTVDGALEAFRLDPTLTLVQGPLEIFKSSTQWTFSPAFSTVMGKRLLRPWAAVNPAGQVLLHAWQADAPGATQCQTGQYWSERSRVVATDGLLAGPQPWEDIRATVSGTSCYASNIDLSYPEFTGAVIAWSPAVSRWVAIWGNSAAVNQQKELTGGYFDADGGLPTRHPLLTGPDDNRFYDPSNYGSAAAPYVAVGPTNILVAWYGWQTTHPMWALFDASATTRITPIQEIFQGGGVVVGAGYGPRGFYVLTRPVGGSPTLRIVSPTTGLQVGPGVVLEARSGSQTTTNSRGYDSTLEPSLMPLNSGFAYIENDFPDAVFGYVADPYDGGYTKTMLPMTAAPRSGFTLVPIDDRTVGVVWTDGQLKRTLMECAP